MAVHGRAKQGRRGTGRLCLPTRSFLARSLTDTHAKPVRCRVCLAVECAFSLCPSLLCPTASPGSGPRVLSALARRAVERRWGAGGRGGRLGRLRGRRRTGQSTHGIVSRKDHLRSGKNATRSRKQSDSAGAVAPRARPSQFAAGDYSRLPLSIASQCQPAPVAAAASRLGLPLSRQAQHPLEPPANVYHLVLHDSASVTRMLGRVDRLHTVVAELSPLIPATACKHRRFPDGNARGCVSSAQRSSNGRPATIPIAKARPDR